MDIAGHMLDFEFIRKDTIDSFDLLFNIRYDNEGNVNYDPGFGISSVAYNCLGRPASAQSSDGSRFSYSWLPDGRKRSYSDSASTITYCDGFIYRNGILQTVMTDNGYIDFTGTAPRQRFFVKDYLATSGLLQMGTEPC